MQAFGLQDQANVLIGTPIRKGISGGQKRRVSVASQLVTGPKLLFLDEPVSGLDSTASREVISFIRDFAKKFQIIVICSIHQPSTVTFNLFDQLVLLARGGICYAGPISGVLDYFSEIGFPAPPQINPAEYLLDLVNADFGPSNRGDGEHDRVTAIHLAWRTQHKEAIGASATTAAEHENDHGFVAQQTSRQMHLLPVLLHRAWIKSYRDLVAYGVRIAMYLVRRNASLTIGKNAKTLAQGLAIMMGTVWLRLDANQESIQPFINALFFGGAFTSFMAVAYVPAYLEDFNVFRKDQANGLYGPTLFMLANFLIGIPYLCTIVLSPCFLLTDPLYSQFLSPCSSRWSAIGSSASIQAGSRSCGSSCGSSSISWQPNHWSCSSPRSSRSLSSLSPSWRSRTASGWRSAVSWSRYRSSTYSTRMYFTG